MFECDIPPFLQMYTMRRIHENKRETFIEGGKEKGKNSEEHFYDPQDFLRVSLRAQCVYRSK